MSKILKFKNPSETFIVRAKSSTTAEIILYGAIGSSMWEDSISAKQFSDQMGKLDKSIKELVIRVNSPGGDVFDGIAIYNRIKQFPGKKKCYVDGLAASIASIIILAADEVVIGEGALVMVHLPWCVTAGNREDLEGTINRLMDVEEQMVSIYAKKTKMPRSEIKAMLEKETWLDSDQAKELGFVDSKSEDTMAIAASTLSKATWMSKTPKMKTKEDQIKEEIENIKTKVSGFLSRK
jgi:ATP-dependent protease ClpP protease subunit